MTDTYKLAVERKAHIERCETRLAEARHAMVQADIYLANGDFLKAHDELAAFLAAAPEEGTK